MKSLRSIPVVAFAAREALAATSGAFNILSMNVAGLPAIFNGNDVPGDKATNAGTIGSYFAEYGYDIINVQEVGRKQYRLGFAALYIFGPLTPELGFQLPRLPLRHGYSPLSHGNLWRCGYWLRAQHAG